MEAALKLFILGVTVSFGPCIAHCSLLILPYIAATTQNWTGGLKAILVFSVARLAIYGVLGLLAGLLGHIIIAQLLQFEYPIMVGGGMFISCLGLYVIFSKKELRHCQLASSKHIMTAGIRGPALLGLFAGILPCLPLLGALTFTALHAQDLWQGAFYGLAFGTGKLFSPLIPLGVLAGAAPALLVRYNRTLRYFTKVCGFVLVLIGISLIIPVLLRP